MRPGPEKAPRITAKDETGQRGAGDDSQFDLHLQINSHS
jgi:hypothetical protein